jgi:hypothetical protein
MRSIVFIGLLLMVEACAPRIEWAKQGATIDELRRDREDCAGEASAFGFLDRDNSRDYIEESRSRRVQDNQADLYRLCMEARGWRRQRAESPPGP